MFDFVGAGSIRPDIIGVEDDFELLAGPAIAVRFAQQLGEVGGLERIVEARLVDELLLEVGADELAHDPAAIVRPRANTPCGATDLARAQVDQGAAGRAVAVRAAAIAVELHDDGCGLSAGRPLDGEALLVIPLLLALGAVSCLGGRFIGDLLRGVGETGVDGGEVDVRAVETRIGEIVGPGDLAELALLGQRLLADCTDRCPGRRPAGS